MSIAKSSFLFSAGTFISRVTGLVRDQIVLGVFGATVFHDAFILAFRIPNLLREILAEGALGSSFTKVYTCTHEKSPQEAKLLLAQALYLTLIISLVLCTLGIFYAAPLVKSMTMNQTTNSNHLLLIEQSTILTKILFPYLGFTIMGSILMGALHQKNRFFLSAFSPVLFNIGNIIGALVIADLLDNYCPNWLQNLIAEPRISGLAIGVLIGGAAHFSIQLWGVWKSSLKNSGIKFYKFPWSRDIKNVFVLMIPAALAASAGPINVFINTNFASGLAPGSITWLNTAFRLLQLPIGIFAVAVGVSVLPNLSKSINTTSKIIPPKTSLEFQHACELVLWLLTPCMLFLVINHEAVIKILFEYGSFTKVDTINTSEALFAYSFGIIGYGLIKVLTSFYYAVERTGFAMKAAIVCIFINFFGNYFLVNSFKYIGLAYTASLTLSVNALILLLGLKKHKLTINRPSLVKTLLLLAGGALICLIIEPQINYLLLKLDYTHSLPQKMYSALSVLFNGMITIFIFLLLSFHHIGEPLLLKFKTSFK